MVTAATEGHKGSRPGLSWESLVAYGHGENAEDSGGGGAVPVGQAQGWQGAGGLDGAVVLVPQRMKDSGGQRLLLAPDVLRFATQVLESSLTLSQSPLAGRHRRGADQGGGSGRGLMVGPGVVQCEFWV